MPHTEARRRYTSTRFHDVQPCDARASHAHSHAPCDSALTQTARRRQITRFLPDHPGGVNAPVLLAGSDATEQFLLIHGKARADGTHPFLEKYGTPFKIGVAASA